MTYNKVEISPELCVLFIQITQILSLQDDDITSLYQTIY